MFHRVIAEYTKNKKVLKQHQSFYFYFLKVKVGLNWERGVGEKRAIRLRNKNFRAPIALKERMREERERENVKIRFIGGNKKQFSVPDWKPGLYLATPPSYLFLSAQIFCLTKDSLLFQMVILIDSYGKWSNFIAIFNWYLLSYLTTPKFSITQF